MIKNVERKAVEHRLQEESKNGNDQSSAQIADKRKFKKMVRETRMDKSSLIYPMFIVEGTNIKEEIPSMMGQYRYSVDRMGEKLEELTKAGIGGVMLFGIPNHKDELGSGAYAQDGIVQQGFRKAKELFPDLYMIGDVCMCEYTSHGHCGVLADMMLDNEQTLELLQKTGFIPGSGWCRYGSTF